MSGIILLMFTQRSFGFDIKDHLVTVPARILDTPNIQYKSETRLASGADWNLNGVKLVRASPILQISIAGPSSWVILFVQKRPAPQHVRDLGKAFVACELTRQTHRFIEPLDVDLRTLISHQQTEERIQNQRNDMIIQSKSVEKAQQGVKLVLIVIPHKLHPRLYGRIKFYGDCNCGMNSAS